MGKLFYLLYYEKSEVEDVQIQLNGSVIILEEERNIGDFLLSKNLNPETVIVEHNGEIVKKSKYMQVVLQERDCLEVMNFVGGG